MFQKLLPAAWAAVAVFPTGTSLPTELSSCSDDGVCEDAGDDTVLLQHNQHKGSMNTVVLEGTPRVTPKGGKFYRESDGEEVVLLGANYVVKGAPYFPPKEIVCRNAAKIAADIKNNAYTPTNGRVKVPAVRLGTLWEGMMPNKPGIIDKDWMMRLEETIQCFEKYGVYVFLDAHSDAWSTTNGGEGFPWWLSKHMQDTAKHGESYITTPEHPLEIALPPFLTQLLAQTNVGVAPVVNVRANDTDPWLNFSVGGGAGDPDLMNIGNVNMRLNNNDAAWATASLVFVKQVQNAYFRFLNSHDCEKDRKAIFEPYIHFVKELFNVWKKHSNIVAVELLNEPPPSGLPCLKKTKASRHYLWTFYAHVLEALHEHPGCARAPIALQSLLGSLPGANPLLDFLFRTPDFDIGDWETKQLNAWAKAGRLILSFHYYPGFVTQLSLDEMVQLALDNAAKVGNVPVWLSEFWNPEAQNIANMMTTAAEEGCHAVTYWHFADSAYTGQPGWYSYPPSVLKHGLPVDGEGNINQEAWAEYIKTVKARTYWGADITGAQGANEDVLINMPAAAAPASSRSAAPSGW